MSKLLMENIKEMLYSTVPLREYSFKKGHGAFIWTSKQKECTLEIGVSVRKGVDCFYLQFPVGLIHLPEIDNIAKEELQTFGYQKSEDYSLQVPFSKVEKSKFDIFRTKIIDTETFNKVIFVFNEMVANIIIPFFNIYKNKSSIIDLLRKSTFEEIVEIFPGYRLFHFSLILLRMSDDMESRIKLKFLNDYLSKFIESEQSEELTIYQKMYKNHLTNASS